MTLKSDKKYKTGKNYSAQVYIDLPAVENNVKEIIKTIRPASLCAVVKADAYGHGIIEVSKTAIKSGASCLAVATVDEGIVLRESGLRAPILVLSEPTVYELEDALSWGLTTTVITDEIFKKLLKIIKSLNQRLENGLIGVNKKNKSCFGCNLSFSPSGVFFKDTKRVPIHLKLETGMSRLGGTPQELLSIIATDQNLISIESIWTHMATADLNGNRNNEVQQDRFNSFVNSLKPLGRGKFYTHMANTAAGLILPNTRMDMVRTGLGIYGYYPADWIGNLVRTHKEVPTLKPVKSVKVPIENLIEIKAGQGVSYGHNFVADKDTAIATVQIGYADGLFRNLSQVNGQVLVRGYRCKIVGNITMNHMMIDVGKLYKKFNISRGEEVVILGEQKKFGFQVNSSGNNKDFDRITADEIAKKLNTISYEILTDLGHTCKKSFIVSTD